MKMTVNGQQRKAKMRAHTATHLLHFALDRLLEGTKQAGSLVDNDLLRFDFSAKKPLSDEQLILIEKQINSWIYGGYTVSVQETTLDEAKKLGAKAFFEDKYGDIVRVVSIKGNDAIALQSVELCGGTHVSSTDHIGSFVITGQEAVASGIRRITAFTGPKTYDYSSSLTQTIKNVSDKLSCQPKQLSEKTDKVLKELEEARSSYESLQTTIIGSTLKTMNRADHDTFEYIISISKSDLQAFDFKAIVAQAKQIRSDKNWLLYSEQGTFALYCGDETSAKAIAQGLSLKGGGSDQLVQGRDSSIGELFAN